MRPTSWKRFELPVGAIDVWFTPWDLLKGLLTMPLMTTTEPTMLRWTVYIARPDETVCPVVLLYHPDDQAAVVGWVRRLHRNRAIVPRPEGGST